MFLFYAFAEFIMAYLMTFRYHTKDWSGTLTDSYYKPFATHVNSLNLWSYASLLLYYSKLGVFGAAFLLQGLSYFNSFLELNIEVWELGVFIGISIVQVVYVLVIAYSYD